MHYGDEWGDECVCVSMYQSQSIRDSVSVAPSVRRITSRYRKHSLLEGSRSSLSRRPALTALSQLTTGHTTYNIIRAQPPKPEAERRLRVALACVDFEPTRT